MSQTTPDDHTGDAEAAEAGWQPTNGSTADAHRCCQNCESHVTPGFRRGFGDEDNIVHHCTQCVDSLAMLRHGAARDPDYDIKGYADRKVSAGRFGNGRGF